MIETMVCLDFPNLMEECHLVFDATEPIPKVDMKFLFQQKLHIEAMYDVAKSKDMVPRQIRQSAYGHVKVACWPTGTHKRTIAKGTGETILTIGPGTGTLASMLHGNYPGWHVKGCKVPGITNFAEGGEMEFAPH